ncbi:hypothetical protein [Streptomyces sp. NPDC050164]|uniref:poly(ethylene terephthalate) hydrolase family protein n=1 Tax=Streptomyces sp. NPDC050164 TaxID=3365605 RepID=UPI0037A4885B
MPGYTATWNAEGAWMGHWMASFGFVVIGIDTNSPTGWDTALRIQVPTTVMGARDEGTVTPSLLDTLHATLPGGSTPPPTDEGPIVGAQSGRCVDVLNNSQTNGTQVQLRDCSSRPGPGPVHKTQKARWNTVVLLFGGTEMRSRQ